MKTRVLMVCLGNICRSPLAEGILRHQLTAAGLADAVEVDSAGTSGWHIGEQPDKRSAANAREHGVEIASLRARQFVVSDFDRFDEIYVMDSENLTNVRSLARSEDDLQKTDLLLNQLHPGQNRAVPDPYYGGEEGFELVYQLVNDACAILVNRFQQKHS
ncbi:MAG: low molecular weight protein-tyrosine-phosphatase [Bacteroidia bacterium]